MHELKFAVGDRVRVIADHYVPCTHRTKIGDYSIVDEVVRESRKGHGACNFQEYRLANGSWVTETEIEAACE